MGEDPNEGSDDALSVSIPRAMIWPVAALAVALLGFVVAYGTILQARAAPARGRRSATDDTGER